MSTPDPNRVIRNWLFLNLGLIVLMVAVGGITRLTGSGLSMVEWKPIMGAVPPVNEAAWQEAFDLYREFPQYQLQNEDMNLSGFKQIFFWEYLHRMLGRLIGLVYGVPFFWFLIRGRIRGRLAGALGVGLVLGGLQGLMGWYMVKSGLVDVPHVSHFRLAAHFMLALTVLAYLTWMTLSLFPERSVEAVQRPSPSFQRLLGLFSAVLVLQIAYGAFVAGTKAGFTFNTFPKMLNHWIPPGLTSMETSWQNLFQNPISLQFIHRGLGWTLALLAPMLWVWGLGKPWPSLLRGALHALALLTLVQFLLGVTTLLMEVHVVPAVMHQVTACLVLMAVVSAWHGMYHAKEIGGGSG